MKKANRTLYVPIFRVVCLGFPSWESYVILAACDWSTRPLYLLGIAYPLDYLAAPFLDSRAPRAVLHQDDATVAGDSTATVKPQPLPDLWCWGVPQLPFQG